MARFNGPPLHEKPFAWSYSKLKNFESCPLKHYKVDIQKAYNESTENLDYGNAVHDAIAHAIGNVGGKNPGGADARPLPKDYAGYQKYVDDAWAARRAGAYVVTELSLAINDRFEIVDWFAPRGAAKDDARQPWFRSKADLKIFKDGACISRDWKTGKPTEDSPQLRMDAIVTFARWPDVQVVKSVFEWLKVDDRSEETVRRRDQGAMWNEIAPRVGQLREAYLHPDPGEAFPPNPSGLCKRYCPVTTCQYHGKGIQR